MEKKRGRLPVYGSASKSRVCMPAHIPKASDTSRCRRGLIVDVCQGARRQMRKDSSRHLKEQKVVARLLHWRRGGRGFVVKGQLSSS